MKKKYNLLSISALILMQGIHCAANAQTGSDAHWTLLPDPVPGVHFTKVDFVDANTGFVAGDQGTFLKTTDGAKTWVSKSFAPGKDIWNIDFVNAKTGYVSVDSLGIMKTEDGGDHWEKIMDIKPGIRVSKIQFLNEKLGFVLTYPDKTLYKTRDGGKSWTGLPILADFKEFAAEPEFNISSIHFVSEELGYAAANYGLAFQTQDGGKTWKTERVRFMDQGRPFNQHPIITSMYFVNNNYGFLSNHMGRIFTTKNSGDSWERRETGIIPSLENALRKVQFIDTLNGYAVGDHGTVIRSPDGGISWQRMDVPTDNLLNDCAVINKDLIYVVGFRGTLLKYSK